MTQLNTNVLHPAWMVGFIDGEGTFFISIQRNATMALGFQVQLQFAITQHNRDKDLMAKFPLFFNAGYLASDGPTKQQFRIRDFKQLDNLFALLDAYPLQTQKRLDAEAFRKVHAMMLNKEHLTQEGLDAIRAIKLGTNRGRVFE